MTPVWIGPELVLARRAVVDGREYIQGCWLIGALPPGTGAPERRPARAPRDPVPRAMPLSLDGPFLLRAQTGKGASTCTPCPS
jgi:hypothetical protein